MNELTLANDGFIHGHHLYLDQEGWIYSAAVATFPYLHEHVEDENHVRGDMTADVVITAVARPGTGSLYEIWTCVGEADYVEGPYLLDSDEGQQTYKEVAHSRRAVVTPLGLA